jgi:hypothetical protein
LNLKRLVDDLTNRLDRFDPAIPSNNKTGLSRWRGKPINPFDEWIELTNTLHELDYFPDDFDQSLTYLLEDGLNGEQKGEDARKWNSDFLELMEYTKNPNYGNLKCFHCLLSPTGDDPIFIGINRLVAKGLNNGALQGDGIQYPCQVVNRFQCPLERNASGKDTLSDVDDLFRLYTLAFAAEISLAKARKDDSEIRIRNKEELFQALTDNEIFSKILDQGAEAFEVGEYIKDYLRENRSSILDYFMGIKDLVTTEELRFY